NTMVFVIVPLIHRLRFPDELRTTICNLVPYAYKGETKSCATPDRITRILKLPPPACSTPTSTMRVDVVGVPPNCISTPLSNAAFGPVGLTMVVAVQSLCSDISDSSYKSPAFAFFARLGKCIALFVLPDSRPAPVVVDASMAAVALRPFPDESE